MRDVTATRDVIEYGLSLKELRNLCIRIFDKDNLAWLDVHGILRGGSVKVKSEQSLVKRTDADEVRKHKLHNIHFIIAHFHYVSSLSAVISILGSFPHSCFI